MLSQGTEQLTQGTANDRNQTISTPHANFVKTVTASNRKIRDYSLKDIVTSESLKKTSKEKFFIFIL